MENLAVPAAVIITEPFISSAKAMALAHGFGDYPFAIIPHPINVTPREELNIWAKEIFDNVEGLLITRPT